MTGHSCLERDEYNPFPVGRRMGKPIIEIVRSQWCLVAAIGLHPPDLHRARALGIEINELSVRRIVRSIIETFGVGEAFFLPAFDRDRINIEFAIALAAEGNRQTVRVPPIPVTASSRSNLARRTPR